MGRVAGQVPIIDQVKGVLWRHYHETRGKNAAMTLDQVAAHLPHFGRRQVRSALGNAVRCSGYYRIDKAKFAYSPVKLLEYKDRRQGTCNSCGQDIPGKATHDREHIYE